MIKRFLVAATALAVAGSAPALAQLSENFDAGIPATWSAVKILASSPFNWTTNNLEQRPNWTAPVGNNTSLCAHADSDHHAGNFDIALVSPSFVVPGGGNAKLDYDTNYQNFANIDIGNVDISTNGGATWTTLLHWQEDHGAFQANPGVHVTINLNAFAGQNAQVRWHYFEPTGGGFDWWWQVDNVSVTPEPASLLLLGLGALMLRRR